MTWQEAIRRSAEGTAVLTRGDYAYLRYPNGATFHATSGDYKIKAKCYENVDGQWEPLGRRIGKLKEE